MEVLSVVPGLAGLQKLSPGDRAIRVAVLDGPVDATHPVFEGADLRVIHTLIADLPDSGRISRHGTHVTSLIFGQPGSAVSGVAPRCQGLILPVFRDPAADKVPQLDLARAIEQAVLEGAHIINISGGQAAPTGEADDILARALKTCRDNNVLVVAAAGNDGCACLHVPAAISTVLAVGALGLDGRPLPISNWGSLYQANGVVAAGEELTGAVPGGGTADMTGTSFATPVVTGVAALLLSTMLADGEDLDPSAVGDAIIRTAAPCRPSGGPECQHFLAGALDVPRALAFLQKKRGGPPWQTSMRRRVLAGRTAAR